MHRERMMGIGSGCSDNSLSLLRDKVYLAKFVATSREDCVLNHSL
jgi:hypothetical protein